ncbi:MAG TPA: hypothetical protein VEU76_00430 [Candidatus Udaeobacter sp.]|nr:hypothetical protein [Candidatus Udaeobacter sp.]
MAFAAAASAAGSLGPGKYTFSSAGADAFFGIGKKGGPPAASWSVSVNRGLNSFKPTHPAAARIVMNSTIVSVAEFDATGTGGYGCFIVPDTDFAVAKDLSGATLHATLTADEACPGYAAAVGGSKDVSFGGASSGLTLPITVDVSWTAAGPTTTFKQTFSIDCLSYSQSGSSSNQNRNAGAAGAISALAGSFNADFADINSGDGSLDIRGVPDPRCGLVG